jgi:hypothetical protein
VRRGLRGLFFFGGGDISDIDKYNFNSDFSSQIFCPGFGE